MKNFFGPFLFLAGIPLGIFLLIFKKNMGKDRRSSLDALCDHFFRTGVITFVAFLAIATASLIIKMFQ